MYCIISSSRLGYTIKILDPLGFTYDAGKLGQVLTETCHSSKLYCIITFFKMANVYK
jgi:hypothetical protein